MLDGLEPFAHGAAWFNRRGERVEAVAPDAYRFRRYALYETPTGPLLLFDDGPASAVTEKD